jgi:hypothetical protein
VQDGNYLDFQGERTGNPQIGIEQEKLSDQGQLPYQSGNITAIARLGNLCLELISFQACILVQCDLPIVSDRSRLPANVQRHSG